MLVLTYLQIRNVIEHEGILDSHLLLNLLIHSTHKSLKDGHAFTSKGTCI